MIEKRATAGVTANGRKLTGYIAKYDSPTKIGSFTETIRRGAFTRTLTENPDILALADHDAAKVLGRTRSGTLELREDDIGLAFTLALPDTQAGRDLVALAERGDIGGASFGFNVPAGGDSWNGNNRELRAVNLAEVSIVSAWPAYQDTEISLRSLRPDCQLSLLKFWLETCQ